MIDPELKALANLSLFNAYFNELGGLAAKYVAAGMDSQVAAETNNCGDNYIAGTEINIWFEPGIFGSSTSCQTIDEALETETAQKIFLEGRQIFERRDGKWYYTGDK